MTMNPIAAVETPRRELAYRESDGIQVTLLWSADDDALTVAVVDTRLGNAFDVPVGEDPPLDVFGHPYAYAARRHIEYVPG